MEITHQFAAPLKITTIIGARPQFIKAAVVSRALKGLGIHEVVIHTGQHYDFCMSDIFFDELAIPGALYNLGIGSGTHGAQTGRMLEAIESALLAEKPDCVLVYGDTNSTLAGALAAAKLHIPVAHVEAGLRSFNSRMPEELNRILTDRMSDVLFAPTQLSVENLRREGILDTRIRLVGDVMYDAALYFAARAESVSKILSKLDLKRGNYILATIHRAENTDVPRRLDVICSALCQMSRYLSIVLPLHPRCRTVLGADRCDELSSYLLLVEPVGYLDMLLLEKNARMIVTDSGGVQKEAFFCRVPCVTLRDETEWKELVELRWNYLAPPLSVDNVLAVLRHVLDVPPGVEAEPYGSGNSAERVANDLIETISTARCAPAMTIS